MRARLEGAMSRRRLRGWNPPLENINALVASGGPRLLARSRELVVTNGYAANACEAFVANLIGDGIKPSSLTEDAECGTRPAALARLDRRGGRGRIDRLLRPAGAGRPRDVRRRRMLRQVAPAPLGRRSDRPVAASASAGGDAALGEDRDCGERQPHSLRHRVRRIGRRVAYCSGGGTPATAPSRAARSSRTGAGTGLGRAAHPPAAGRGADARASACRPGAGAAVPARSVRRRRARPEEDRGDVRGLHHQDRPGRADDGRGGGGSDGAAIASLEPGTMQVLLPGEDVRFSSPADVGGGYEAFQYRTLLAVSASLGLPYHLVTGDSGRRTIRACGRSSSSSAAASASCSMACSCTSCAGRSGGAGWRRPRSRGRSISTIPPPRGRCSGSRRAGTGSIR